MISHYNTHSTQKSLVRHKKYPVRHKNTWFDTKNARFDRNYPACISCHCHYQTQTSPPLFPLRNFFFQFYSNILFLRTHRKFLYEKWNYIDIQIYLISLWKMKCDYSFLLVLIIMSAAIDKYYWYGSITLPTSAFSFDCSIKIWHTLCWSNSIMHSTRTFIITVSHDRVSCRPHLEHLAAAVLVTRALGCLTAADHCYVMLGTIKFVDKSINDK